MEKILKNPTLYPHALTDCERDPSFKWHNHAGSPRSSQVFCISAFGTLRKVAVGNRVLSGLLGAAFPVVAKQRSPAKWALSHEVECADLLNEKGGRQPTSIDVLCASSQNVVCIESKFVSDAVDGFGRCSQALRGDCAGYYGPGSDKKTGTNAWCRLEGWEGGRSPRLYWSLGKSYFKQEAFDLQSNKQACPFSGPFYQLMRNFLFAAAMAGRDRKKFFGVMAISPEPTSAALRSQVQEFRQNILRPEFRDHVKFQTYETLIDHLRNTGDQEAIALAGFLEERIATICGNLSA